MSSETSQGPAAPTSTFTPAIPPPLGVTPNPNHPASLAHLSHITVSICLPTITIFFLLRSYVRFYNTERRILEDVMATIAWAGTVAYCGIMETVMAHGGGKHAWDITTTQFESSAYWFNVAAIEYGVMVCIVKLAVLCLYARVFAPKRWSPLYNAIIFLAVVCIAFYTATSLVKIFECIPRAKLSNPSIPGHCVNLSLVLMTSGSFNFVTDYLILLLPIHAVWKLRMSRRKKSLVVLVFTFGLCAPIFATIGFVVRIRNSSNRDKSWRQPEILLWGAAELSSGNLCVCFPQLGPLLPKLLRLLHISSPSRQVELLSEHALPETNTPIVAKPKRTWFHRCEHRGRNAIDSGIGAATHNRGRKTYGERVLPRGWLDSGIGSNKPWTGKDGASTDGQRAKDVSPASSKTVGGIDVEKM